MAGYFLNLDFIYYLIYVFFRTIFDLLSGGAFSGGSSINILDLFNYFTNSNYTMAGEGLGAFFDGYSLFRPPHGIESWGSSIPEAVSNWFGNFMVNPYCPECSSFFDLIFGGFNLLFWLLLIVLFILWLFLQDKKKRLEAMDWEKYEKVFDRDEENINSHKSERWNNILKLVESENKNDWKVAIIDADTLLDEVLLEQGFNGTNLGERLKSADFDSLQNAWEAHKIRNLIAHDKHYDLSKRDAKRAIQNYSLVFNEFYYL